MAASAVAGSSPLARGLPYPPAGGVSPPVDHPRSRGVYCRARRSVSSPMGSSPLARGLPHEDHDSSLLLGIIPARAGFTSAAAAVVVYVRDHPRSRGVYSCSSARITASAGSSPLARGLPLHSASPDRPERIIPARAGFTRLYPWPLDRSQDHPRSRGVYLVAAGLRHSDRGSSPLARGLHLRILGIPTTSHSTRPRLHSLPT